MADFFANARQLPAETPFHRGAGLHMRAPQGQQFADFGKRESERLRAPDEPERIDFGFAIQAKAARCARQARKQGPPLVKPDRIRGEPRSFSDLANPHGSFCLHKGEYTLEYRPESRIYCEGDHDQKQQVENLKTGLVKLGQKREEARSKKELLLARQRRSVALKKATAAHTSIGENSKSATFERLKERGLHGEATGQAEAEVSADDFGDQLVRLDREVEVERLLQDLKQKRGLAN
jgi:hypothetical protein